MPRVRLFFILSSIWIVFSNDNDTLRCHYQQINRTPVVHGATDFNSQLVALKALFISKMYELKREMNRLRENINKRDQNTGENNLYHQYNIKNYYLEQQNSFLRQELSLKQNTIDKILEINSSQCKDMSYSKKR